MPGTSTNHILPNCWCNNGDESTMIQSVKNITLKKHIQDYLLVTWGCSMLFSFHQLKSSLRLFDWVSLLASTFRWRPKCTECMMNVWDDLPTLGETWPHSKGNEGTYCLHGASGIWWTCFLLHNFHMYQLRFQCPALGSNNWNSLNVFESEMDTPWGLNMFPLKTMMLGRQSFPLGFQFY